MILDILGKTLVNKCKKTAKNKVCSKIYGFGVT